MTGSSYLYPICAVDAIICIPQRNPRRFISFLLILQQCLTIISDKLYFICWKHAKFALKSHSKMSSFNIFTTNIFWEKNVTGHVPVSYMHTCQQNCFSRWKSVYYTWPNTIFISTTNVPYDHGNDGSCCSLNWSLNPEFITLDFSDWLIFLKSYSQKSLCRHDITEILCGLSEPTINNDFTVLVLTDTKRRTVCQLSNIHL
jgi:hypothetical protein